MITRYAFTYVYKTLTGTFTEKKEKKTKVDTTV